MVGLNPQSMEICRIIKPGIFTTVQDLGRRGFYSQGIPDGGAFDFLAFRMGNLLLRNSPQAAGLEILLGGLCLEFLQDTWIAITGGNLRPEMDGNSVNMWQTVAVERGQRVSFPGRSEGLRAYLLFEGGLDVPYFLGSRSTYVFLKKGGFQGRKLQKGDTLRSFLYSAGKPSKSVPKHLRPVYRPPWQLHIIYGLQVESFTESSLRLFESTSWTVTPESDRMGIRLSGQTLKFNEDVQPHSRQIGGSDPSNITTEGNPLGSIQVPGGSQLIIIGPDGPCEGGYVKLGTITSADFSLLGQILPGDQVRFEPVSLAEAYQELYKQRATCEDYEALESP
jgi:biotin-dependent carboxylase-like uncharacterized protein